MITFPGEIRLLFEIHQNHVDEWVKNETNKIKKRRESCNC